MMGSQYFLYISIKRTLH